MKVRQCELDCNGLEQSWNLTPQISPSRDLECAVCIVLWKVQVMHCAHRFVVLEIPVLLLTINCGKIEKQCWAHEDQVSEWRNPEVSHSTPLWLNGSQHWTSEFWRCHDDIIRDWFKERDFPPKRNWLIRNSSLMYSGSSEVCPSIRIPQATFFAHRSPVAQNTKKYKIQKKAQDKKSTKYKKVQNTNKYKIQKSTKQKKNNTKLPTRKNPDYPLHSLIFHCTALLYVLSTRV